MTPPPQSELHPLQTLTVVTRPVENRAAVIFRARRAHDESFTVFPSSHARMSAMESALETSAMMSGHQLVASATISAVDARGYCDTKVGK